jgi:hypothetical protein
MPFLWFLPWSLSVRFLLCDCSCVPSLFSSLVSYCLLVFFGCWFSLSSWCVRLVVSLDLSLLSSLVLCLVRSSVSFAGLPGSVVVSSWWFRLSVFGGCCWGWGLSPVVSTGIVGRWSSLLVSWLLGGSEWVLVAFGASPFFCSSSSLVGGLVAFFVTWVIAPEWGGGPSSWFGFLVFVRDCCCCCLLSLGGDLGSLVVCCSSVLVSWPLGGCVR